MIEKLSLKGKGAIVVGGGGGGIGTAIATAFSEAGASVLVVDVIADRAEEAAKAIRAAGGAAHTYVGDVREKPVVTRMVETAAAKLGGVHVLANVVGATSEASWKPALDYDEQVWDDDIRLNLRCAFFSCQAAARQMVKQGRGGSIVNIASTSGLRASTLHIAYGAAKAGIMSMTRTLAVEWGPHKIRVNAVAPGAIRTPKTRDRMDADPGRVNYLSQLVPLGRPGRPEDIAMAALFMASELAQYVTGQTITVDGGVMAVYPLGGGRR